MTSRQQQIWALVAQGKTNREIGAVLSLSEKTIKAHMTAIFKRRGCKNRVQLALLWPSGALVAETKGEEAA